MPHLTSRPARAVLDRMEGSDAAIGEFHRLDAEFHVGLVTLSGNVLVAAVMSGLRGAINECVMAGTRALPDWSATARRLRAEHRGVLDAVASGRPADATEAVKAHIEGFYREPPSTASGSDAVVVVATRRSHQLTATFRRLRQPRRRS